VGAPRAPERVQHLVEESPILRARDATIRCPAPAGDVDLLPTMAVMVRGPRGDPHVDDPGAPHERLDALLMRPFEGADLVKTVPVISMSSPGSRSPGRPALT
jgi:hypothetical protein